MHYCDRIRIKGFEMRKLESCLWKFAMAVSANNCSLCDVQDFTIICWYIQHN